MHPPARLGRPKALRSRWVVFRRNPTGSIGNAWWCVWRGGAGGGGHVDAPHKKTYGPITNGPTEFPQFLGRFAVTLGSRCGCFLFTVGVLSGHVSALRCANRGAWKRIDEVVRPPWQTGAGWGRTISDASSRASRAPKWLEPKWLRRSLLGHFGPLWGHFVKPMNINGLLPTSGKRQGGVCRGGRGKSFSPKRKMATIRVPMARI